MKYPKLTTFSVDALICLAEQSNNIQLINLIKKIITEKLNIEHQPSSILIAEYLKSNGLKKSIIGEVIAIRLINDINIVEVGFIDLLLDDLDSSTIWALSNDAILPEVRLRAKRRIINLLNEFEEVKEIKEILDEKISLDKEEYNLTLK